MRPAVSCWPGQCIRTNCISMSDSLSAELQKQCMHSFLNPMLISAHVLGSILPPGSKEENWKLSCIGSKGRLHATALRPSAGVASPTPGKTNSRVKCQTPSKAICSCPNSSTPGGL